MKPTKINNLIRLAKATLLWAVLGLAACASRGQALEQVLRSFGYPGGANPEDRVIQGSDGALYGTTFTDARASYPSGPGTVFKVNTDGTGYTVLHAFGGTGDDGAAPQVALVQGSDGALYGTTRSGGTYNNGTVFKLSTNGSGYTTLYSFAGINGNGPAPNGLVQGTDGALYGTTCYGGTNDNGTVFKLSTNGSGYTLLYSFTGTNGDGAVPASELVQGSDGLLYGTTLRGGTSDNGTVFKLGTDGSGYTVLYSFTGSNGDGAVPGGLVQGVDGTLYGTTISGGTYNNGTVFKLSTDGSGYAVLYNFGDIAPSALMQAADGALYGTTQHGGTYGVGTVFKLNPDGSGYTTIYNFTGTVIGTGRYSDNPCRLVQGRDGACYGTTLWGGIYDQGTVFKLNTDGTGYTRLHSFTGAGQDGARPNGLLQGRDGALYGTTAYTGTNDGSVFGDSPGTVFKVNTDGTGYATLYRFTGTAGDGALPQAGLVQGTDGTLYGTTMGGGTSGNGTVFKLSTNGTGYATLYRFTGVGGDGANPGAGLVQGSDGVLYGTTSSGGTNRNGTVFKLSTNGTGYATLYRFTGVGGDGRSPNARLVQGNDGGLYGTTQLGGTYDYGTVFKLSTNGTGYATLYRFTGVGGDGRSPNARLVQGNDGGLYGTTQLGGTYDYGTVFKLSTNGTGYSRLHIFTGTGGDGEYPNGLVQGNDGALYGTASWINCGNCPAGTAFKLSTNGTDYTTLHTFTGAGGDGAQPNGLVQGADGTLFGTTAGGGFLGWGTVFRLCPAPFIVQIRRLPDRNVSLSTITLPSTRLQFAASTNLVDWSTLTNFTGAAGAVQFNDLTATNFPRRFYRAVWTP